MKVKLENETASSYLNVVPKTIPMNFEVNVRDSKRDDFPIGYRDCPNALCIVWVGIWVIWGYQHPIVDREPSTTTYKY